MTKRSAPTPDILRPRTVTDAERAEAERLLDEVARELRNGPYEPPTVLSEELMYGAAGCGKALPTQFICARLPRSGS